MTLTRLLFVCQNFHSLEADDDSPPPGSHGHRVLGFQRRHSLCPVTLPNSKFNGGGGGSGLTESAFGGLSFASNQQQRGGRALPRSALSHVPFRVDRSVSMIEGRAGEDGASPPPLLPPPGLCLSSASLTSTPSLASPKPPASPPHISSRYKTELCRTFEESGTCKYGAKCQFAHGLDELRGLSRHPKYKTEPCRTFHTIGFCPYGARCHFVHNADEAAGAAAAPPRPKLRPPLLRHSLSFAGFSSSPHTFQPVEESSSLFFARASSVSPPPSSTGTPELLSPLLPEPRALTRCPYAFSGLGERASDAAPPRFYATTDSRRPAPSLPSTEPSLSVHLPQRRPAAAPLGGGSGLQRCSSADSLCEDGYASSCSLSSSSSRTESPSCEGRRLPIFSRLSVTDE